MPHSKLHNDVRKNQITGRSLF